MLFLGGTGRLGGRHHISGCHVALASSRSSSRPARGSTSSTSATSSPSRFGDALDAYPRALCCSFHTTAGYLDRGVAARLKHNASDVMPYIDVFRTMFPEGAGYEHDKLDRRTELTAEQRPREPRNADSHLAFMAGALRTCVSYPNRRRRADRVRGPRWRARRSGAAAPHDRARIYGGGARRTVAHRRSDLEPLGRFGESEGPELWASTRPARNWWRSTA